MPWDGCIRDEIAAEFARLSDLPELHEGHIVRSADRAGERVRILTCTFAGCAERRRTGRGERYCDRHRGRHRARATHTPTKRPVVIRSSCIECHMPIVADVFHFKCRACRR